MSERGIHAATTMGQLRTVVHALAALDLEPDELLARLYDTAARLAEERAQLPQSDPLNQEPLAATCAYAVYDPFTETCTVASAGHPAPSSSNRTAPPTSSGCLWGRHWEPLTGPPSPPSPSS